MRCRDCQFELGIGLRGGQGVLTPEVQAHVAACPECARFAAEMRGTAAAVGALPALGAPDGFRQRLQARLNTEAPTPQRGGAREFFSMPALTVPQACAAAAVLLVAILLLGVALHGMMPAAGIDTGQLAYQTRHFTPFAGAGATLPAALVQPMVQHHQTQQIAYPLHHDAGFYMVSGD